MGLPHPDVPQGTLLAAPTLFIPQFSRPGLVARAANKLETKEPEQRVDPRFIAPPAACSYTTSGFLLDDSILKQVAVVAVLKQHGLGTVQGFWTCGCGMRTWERAALVHLGTAKLSQSWYYEIKYILDHLGTKYIQVPCFLLTPYFYSNS